MNPAKLSRPLQLDYSIDMKMSRFFLGCRKSYGSLVKGQMIFGK